ncbi:MAG TPA: hypothetical protein PLK52_06850 [Usitatibacteraceae bacterium]|nr:hypothetical protein [Usitatibacteraceae bacterium]HQY48148.1 hypothetical protein [Usitatibacteraceae bacterium]HRA23261.1 hypothetical protein [Usitatibacteraceae bacterium]
MTKTFAILAAALTLGGCASSYQLTLMPRDSGKLYFGTAEDTGGSEGAMAIEIEGRTYRGTWVEVVADRTTGYVAGGFGGGRRGWAAGSFFSMENPRGSEAKALLRSEDGAGLRCDLRGGAGRPGGGTCRDDRGLEYDVQVRVAPRR